MKNQEKTISTPEGGVLEAPKRTVFYLFWRLFRKNKTAVAGMLIFVAFFILAVVGLAVTSGREPILDPSLVRLQEKLRPPFSKPMYENLRPYEFPKMGIYVLGTDELGRDVFARMLQGAWVSLTVGFVAVGISVIIGVILGGWAGYYGSHKITVAHVSGVLLIALGLGWLFKDQTVSGVFILCLGVFTAVIVRKIHKPTGKIFGIKNLLLFPVISVDGLITGLIDIMLCFPSFFLILTVVALLPASIYNIMIIIGITSWMGAARFVRAEFLSLREMDFITASRALGVRDGRIIFLHMIPNAIAPVLVSATIGIASAILSEAGLSFLGFGVQPPTPSWGNILTTGRQYMRSAPHIALFPGLAITITVLAFNLLGDGLRDALDPRLKV